MDGREEVRKRLSTGGTRIDCHTHVGADFGAYVHFAYPYAMSVEDLVIRMDGNRIGCSVAFPFGRSAYFEVDREPTVDLRTSNRLCRFPYEIENRSLLREVYEVFPEYSERILPFAMFDPCREPEAQAELLTELHETYGIYGLKFVATYIKSFVRDLPTKGRPILDFALRYDLPILLHSSYDRRDPWAPVEDIASFAESNPSIRVTVAHSARFHVPTLERVAPLPNCFVDLSAFDIHCELARMNHPAVPPAGPERFDAPYDKPEAVMRLLCDRYPDTIVWGSDIPFNYFIQKFSYASGETVDLALRSRHNREVELLDSLPPETQRIVAQRNTLRFLFG